MSLLREFVELITVPPGDLVYHLVTLFAIQLILGVAFGHWNRNRRDPAAIRLLVVGAGFFLARALLMLVAILSRVGMLSPNTILPPLERLFDLAAVLLVAWAFLPILERHSRLGLALLFITLAMAGVAYAAFAILWRRVDVQSVAYNGYWQEGVWEFSTLALLVLALIAGAIWRTGDWGLLICLFGLWFGGHALQFVAPITGSHTAGWVRLANLAALPLLAGLVYRRALSVPLGWVAAGGSADEDATLGVAGILKANQRIEAGRDVEAALGLAASSVARALGADVVAIGMPLPEPAKGIRAVALHPPTSVTLVDREEPTLPLANHPLLATAIQTGRLQRAYAPRKISITADLYRCLGFERPGPLLIQPLTDEGALLGALLVGNPLSQQHWSARDEQIVQAMGAALAASLANARRRETRPSQQDRNAELQETRDEAHRLAQRASELETALKHQRRRAEELSTKLRLREREVAEQDQAAEAAIWQEEMSKLTQARAALETELAEWKERAEYLARLKAGPPDGAEEEATRKNELVVSLIHELRGPMSSITDSTDWMLRKEAGGLDEKQRQFLLRVEANVERMERLLNDMVIKLTDVGAGLISRSSGLMSPVAVVAVIEKAIESLSARFDESQLSVRIDAPPTSDLPPVRADREGLYRVVRNLLSNAGQCSAPGSEILVRVHSEVGGSQIEDSPPYLLVSVTDTGGGIAPQDQQRVFQRLQRADAPPIAGLGETGDGLSVAKALVEALGRSPVGARVTAPAGGRLWVESEMGVGSTFNFILLVSSEDDRVPSPAEFDETGSEGER